MACVDWLMSRKWGLESRGWAHSIVEGESIQRLSFTVLYGVHSIWWKGCFPVRCRALPRLFLLKRIPFVFDLGQGFGFDLGGQFLWGLDFGDLGFGELGQDRLH